MEFRVGYCMNFVVFLGLWGIYGLQLSVVMSLCLFVVCFWRMVLYEGSYPWSFSSWKIPSSVGLVNFLQSLLRLAKNYEHSPRNQHYIIILSRPITFVMPTFSFYEFITKTTVERGNCWLSLLRHNNLESCNLIEQ